jgi:hypothetical protein
MCIEVAVIMVAVMVKLETTSTGDGSKKTLGTNITLP